MALVLDGNGSMTVGNGSISGLSVGGLPSGVINSTNIVDATITQGDLDTSIIPLGAGQTWSNLTASRTSGTTYTNSTGRPIMVTVCTNMATNARIEATVGGVKIVDMGGSTIYGDMGLNVFIVPNSTTYVVTATQGTIQIWAELR
jgi:hypothetical protein